MEKLPGPGWIQGIFFVILIVFLWSAGCAGNTPPAQEIPKEIHNTSPPSVESPLPVVPPPTEMPKVNLTVNTARKVRLIGGTGPTHVNYVLWLIVDISIENTGFTSGYAFTTTNIVLMDQENHRNISPSKYHVHISDPMTDGIIPWNTKERGEILFAANVTPHTYLFVLNDANGAPLVQREITTVEINDYDPNFAYTEVADGQISTLAPRGYTWSGDRIDLPAEPSGTSTTPVLPSATAYPVTTGPAVSSTTLPVPAPTETGTRETDLLLLPVAGVIIGILIVGGGAYAIRKYPGRTLHPPAAPGDGDAPGYEPPFIRPAARPPAPERAAPGKSSRETILQGTDAGPKTTATAPESGQSPEAADTIPGLQSEATNLRNKASDLRHFGSVVTARLTTADKELRTGNEGAGRAILRECRALLDQLQVCESELVAWRSAGYNTASLETDTNGDPLKIIDNFRQYQNNIRQMEDLRDQFGALKKTYSALISDGGVNEKIRSLEASMNNPARVDVAKSAFLHLKEELQQEQVNKKTREREMKARAAELLAKAEEFGEVPGPVREGVASDDLQVLKDTVGILESFRSTAIPELVPLLETQHFIAGSWHKARIRIANTGAAHAFDVRLSFSEDIEIRRLKPARVLARETISLEIGMMPRTQGSIPLEITLACHDINGKEYTTVHELWIEVADRGKIHGARVEGDAPEAERAIPAIDVFISYSHEDKNVSDAVCHALESDNVRCWVAPRDILPGMQFQESIIDAIDTSSIMVIIFSSHSNISPHVISEVTEAMSKGVIIIPFRIEDVLPSKAMKYLIGASHWLDAITPPLGQHIGKLVRTVKLLLENQDK